MTAYRLFSI